MPVIDYDNPEQGGGGNREPLESDVYEATIKSCKYQVSQYKRDDGSEQMEYWITWVEKESQNFLSQYFNEWYGVSAKGVPSKWKAFLDKLYNQGLIDSNQFDPETALVGITQRIAVEKYIKTKGTHAGEWGNKITNVMPLKKESAVKEDPIPF
jgi:hypothetical protein